LQHFPTTTSQDLDKKEQEKSLQELRSELRKDFETLSVPIIVVIDDIDRLTEEEICLVFRLVKANADFPNLIFLLLFQRETAEQALDHIAGNNGRLFLEKIVQVGINLPPVPPGALRETLVTHINKILEPFVSESELERDRFADFWFPGLSHYFTNFREVYRFLSSFSFCVTAFAIGGVLEVNPFDLIAIETLRIAEPDVYELIRNNKAVLLKGSKEERAALGEALLKDSKRKSPEALRSILKDLFPQFRNVWDNWNYSDESSSIWASKRRICIKRFFDRYFLLGVPPEQVGEALIKQILDRSGDRGELLRIFRKLREEGLLIDCLDRLAAEESLGSLRDPFPYLVTLADIGDFIPRNKVFMLTLHGDLYTRAALESTSLYITSSWLRDFEETESMTAMLPQFSPEEFKRLKQVWLMKVEEAASTGRLLEIRELYAVLFCWQKWSGAEKSKKWASHLLNDSRAAVRLLCALVTESSSQTVGSYHVSDSSWMDWKILRDFCSLAEWQNLDKHLAVNADFDDEEKRSIRLFKQAMEKWSNEPPVPAFNEP
jgi:hypothetical protein